MNELPPQAMTLDAACVLSPGDKARTRPGYLPDEMLFVVQMIDGGYRVWHLCNGDVAASSAMRSKHTLEQFFDDFCHKPRVRVQDEVWLSV